MSNPKSLANRRFASSLIQMGLMVMVSGACYAQSAPAPISAPAPRQEAAGPAAVAFQVNSSATEIQKINEDMTVMSARLAQLELQAKIETKKKEISAMDTQQSSRSPLSASASIPSVVSVSGIKGDLEAVLVFPAGLSQRVKKGDVIGDRKVATVAINQVILTDMSGKNPQRLAFGTTATAIAREGAAAAASQMPSFQTPPMPMSPPGYPAR